jgi:restriction endonuclease Mrr
MKKTTSIKRSKTKAKVVKQLKNTGFPTHSPYYKTAHREADNAERRTFPKAYQAMKKVDKKLSKNALAGKNLKSGKIEVSQKVPPAYRRDVILHERTESLAIKRLSKKRKK